MRVKRINPRPKIKVTGDGEGVVSHAGDLLLAELADGLGLRTGLSALAPTRKRRSAHDPGEVLLHLAVTLADGGDCLSDLKVLREQPELFGTVASDPTAWRVIDAVGEAALALIGAARAAARARAWAAGARPGWIVLDIDGTLVGAHSEKEGAAPTYKRGFGFHPMLCVLDGTGEVLSGMLRPGNAGSGTAADHIGVLDAALAQLPVTTRAADPEAGEWMLVRGDSAACSHEFLDACRSRGVEFSVGFTLTADVRSAVLSVPERAWVEAIGQDPAEIREEAQVAEITDRLDLSAWPAGTRAIARRELAHPGAQLTFTDADGHRFQVFITDSREADIAFLEARHRGHARVEDRIRAAKDSGLRNLPFSAFAHNRVWLALVLVGLDLVAWAQRLCLEGALAAAEPKRLRYALWHCAGRLVRSGRRLILRLQSTWPWVKELVAAFARLRALAGHT